ncbi:MAG: hypothetical protein U9P68_10925 [Pseudomonadota bacterium]|jgi:hypothetical protein|nr:hypothetical protein [Pseudomonadota bacterium]
MQPRLRHTACTAGLVLASLALGAQSRPATQPATLQTTDLPRAVLQQAPSPATPDDPRVMPINWVEARQDARTQTQFDTRAVAARRAPRFPQPGNEGAEAVTDTRLPVLIPSSNALGLGADPQTLLFPRENFYTLSITGADILVEVFGTRLAHATAPDDAAGRRLRAGDGDGYRVTATRYGQELSFNRYGAAYSITVECTRPEEDARCTAGDYVRRLADSLLIAAGRPDEGGE